MTEAGEEDREVRDTGLALYALAMIRRWAPNATVTITPTDHYVAPASP